MSRSTGRSPAAYAPHVYRHLDAATADRWGLVDRALPPDEVWPFVDALAARIASLPPVVVALAKAAVGAAEPDPAPGLLTEWQRFTHCLAAPEAAARMERFLAAGGQTPDVERRPITLAGGAWG